MSNSSEQAALHLHHMECCEIVVVVGRASAVAEQQTFISTVVRLPYRRVDADIGGDSGKYKVSDAVVAQDKIKLGSVEGTFAGLINHPLALDWSNFGDDLPSRFTTHKDSPTGTGRADLRADAL